MSELQPLQSVDAIARRWPGALDTELPALQRFLFHADHHFPEELHDQLVNGWPDTEHEILARELLDELKHCETGSRFERSKWIAQRAAYRTDERTILNGFKELSTEEAREQALAFFDRWPSFAKVTFKQSPLYPYGRTAHAPIDHRGATLDYPFGTEKVIRFGQLADEPAPEELTDFIVDGYERQKAQEFITEAALGAPVVDVVRHNHLRSVFGTKATNLILFKEHLDSIYLKIQNLLPKDKIIIPAFIPVSVDLYNLWQSDTPGFEKELTKLQAAALELVIASQSDTTEEAKLLKYQVVAIRSSAVKSEDGEDVTGAGIYDSVGADPRDPIEFRKAVEQVFASTNSPRAIHYRKQHHIPSENMGLVVQLYQDEITRGWSEEVVRGTINSQSSHAKLMEVSTSIGSLLFDRDKVINHLLAKVDPADLLHTIPDRNQDGLAAHDIALMTGSVHAAMLAERFFGKPVQVEFSGRNIFQVRPLPKRAFEIIGRHIEFPTDLEPLDWCRATGVGDMTLEILNNRDFNDNSTGVVVFSNENKFTLPMDISGNNGDDALPKVGATIILHNDGYSGHAQMRSQERGLLCLFPEVGSYMNLRKEIQQLHRNGTVADTLIRVISDGYKGAIYLVDRREYAERKAALLTVANALAATSLRLNSTAD